METTAARETCATSSQSTGSGLVSPTSLFSPLRSRVAFPAPTSVRLFQQGLQIVEVSDDGCGVPPESRRLLATPHATSKITSTHDIGQSMSLGFRGEALFSLAALSEKLIVATRVHGEDVAEKLEFRRDGSVDEASVQRFPKKIGTTVAVVGLFAAFPVRRNDLKQRLPHQRSKLLALVEAYALFHPGIRIHLMDMVGKTCREQTLLATTNNATTLRETVSSVLGPKFLDSLCPIELETERCTLAGLLSKAGNAVASPRKLVAINQRPIEWPKLVRSLNAVWRQRGHNRDPSWCLSLTVPINEVDVNLTPDKRTVLLQHETDIVQAIVSHVEALWTSQSNGAFPVGRPSSGDTSSSRPHPPLSVPVDYDSPALSDDDDDDHDEDDETASPSRFNRRYAFSHDVSKARLQHEYDDGRKRRKRPPISNIEGESAAAEVEPFEALVGPTQKRLKQLQLQQCAAALSEPPTHPVRAQDPVTPSPVGAMESLRPPATSPSKAAADVAPAERPGDSERTSLNCSNGEEDPDLPRESARLPMSPDDARRWRSTQQAFNSTSGIQEDLRVAQTVTNERGSNGFNFAQFGLNQTSGAIRKPAVSGSASTKRLVSDEDIPESHFRLPPMPERSPPNREASSMASQLLSRHEPDLEVRRRESSSSSDDDDSDQGSSSKGDAKPLIARLPTIVWDSFGSTEDVIQVARRERLALRDRKRHLQDSERSNPEDGLIRLSNDDLGGLEVIGQFNLGFILARSPDHHLWILDQHACDEKYNFEKLCAETVIHEQRLLAPMPLELSPAEEMCVLDHMDVFEANGFRFQVDLDKPPRHRLALTALPHSGAREGRKSVLFGKDDVSALCNILGADDNSSASVADAAGSGTGVDGSGVYGNNAVRRYAGGGVGSLNTTTNTITGSADKIIARLPKAIAMFASRACRGSIMIGKALSAKEMDRIVRRLRDLNDAWSCPHGRPTMRHVVDLQPHMLGDERRIRDGIAGPTLTLATQDAMEPDD